MRNTEKSVNTVSTFDCIARSVFLGLQMQILQTYCERYDFTVEKVDAQLDWAYFEDNEGETITDAFGVTIVEDSEIKES